MSGDLFKNLSKSLIARMWAFWALSSIPWIRISSISLSRSGVVFLGGRATVLRDTIGASLRDAGFVAEPNEKLPGLDRSNICNRTHSGEGVQLELPRSLRSRLATEADVLQVFCEAIRNSILSSPAF